MVGPRGDAEDLLLRCAVKVVHAHAAGVIHCRLRSEVPGINGIVPVFPVVEELRKQAVHVGHRSRAQLIIGAACEAKARSVIPILANVFTEENRNVVREIAVGSAGNPRHRLNIIDPAVVVVVAAAQQETKTLFISESPAEGSAELIQGAAAGDGRESAHGGEADIGLLGGFPGHEIHGAPDGIPFLVGGKSFVDFDRIDEVGGNRIKLYVAHAFWRRHMYAVDGDIAEARLRAADLDVLAFAFVALEGNAGHAADGIGNISIRQAGDDFAGEHLHDIVRGNLTIEGFNFAVFAFPSNNDLFADGLDL